MEGPRVTYLSDGGECALGLGLKTSSKSTKLKRRKSAFSDSTFRSFFDEGDWYDCYETTLVYGVGVRSKNSVAIHDRTAASVKSFFRCLISEINLIRQSLRSLLKNLVTPDFPQ